MFIENKNSMYIHMYVTRSKKIVKVIRNLHLNDDMSEIYVERGNLGKPFEKELDGKLKRVNNEKVRVTYERAFEGYSWRIHGSLTPNGVTFKIKTFNN
ncbi:hypothetical protein CR513_54725, partial [Mucuna pruriens]